MADWHHLTNDGDEFDEEEIGIDFSKTADLIEKRLQQAIGCEALDDEAGVRALSIQVQIDLRGITYDLPVRHWPAHLQQGGTGRLWREPSQSDYFRWQGTDGEEVILSADLPPGETAGYPRATSAQHLDFLRHAEQLAYSLMDC